MFQTVSGEAYAPVADFQVSADTLEYQTDVAFAKLGDGGFVAVWSDSRFAIGSMRMQRFDLNGVKVGSEIILPAGSTPALASTPTGGFLLTWTVMEAYPANSEVKARFYDSNLNPTGPEIPVNTTTDAFQENKSVAALAGGGYVITWGQRGDGGFDHVRAQILDSAGNKIGGEIIVTENVPGNKHAMGLTALAGGGFVAAWSGFEVADEFGNLSNGLRAQVFDSAGNKVGAAFSLNTIVPGTQSLSELAALPTGGFVAAWADDGGRQSGGPGNGNQGVWVQLFDSLGQKVGAAMRLGPAGDGPTSFPTIAVTATGFIVTWPRLANVENGQTELRAQRFDFDGNKIAEEFVVGSSIAGGHFDPTNIVLDSGAILLGWTHRPTVGFTYEDVRAQLLFPVVHGTEGEDGFAGTASRDFFLGKGGEDFAAGAAGDDNLDGGDGNDFLQGGTGNDVIHGGDGDDLIRGEDGNDQLFGDGGNDNLRGGRGVDSFDGGANDEVLNQISSYGDRVSFFEQAATHGAVADLRTGIISNDGFGNAETMINVESLGGDTAFADTFYGNDNRNALLGSRGDNLYGFGGDDIVYLGAAPAVVDGGSGADILILQGDAAWLLPDSDGDGLAEFAPAMTFGWFVDLESNYIEDGYGNSGTVLSFEAIHGSEFDDVFFGGGADDIFEGGGGDDILYGFAGADFLSGGEGNDLLRGNDGVDQYDGGDDDGAFTDGSLGYGDRVSFFEAFATQGAVADLRTGIISNDGFGNVETMTGIESLGGDTAYADTFYGNDSINFLLGSRGDSLFGFDGDDLLLLTSAAAAVDGGAGVDQLELRADLSVLLPDSNGDGNAETAPAMTVGWNVSLAAGTLTDGYGNVGTVTGIENLVGSGLGDELRGNALANILTGGAGNDFLLIQDGGDDIALGGAGNDVLYFGTGLSAGDVADGGADRDAIVFQGNVIAVLTDTNLVGIESISIQSGANTRFGDTANNFYDFDVTTADGNVLAGQQLIVNAQSLRAGEDFTFDGSAETDGKFLVYGGHGVDDLTGGDGVDVFLFEGQRWGAGDKVDGGDGRDALVISAGDGLAHIAFGADSLTSIESISLNNRYATDPTQKPSYDLVLHNGNVAAGGTLIVNGSSIPLGQVVMIDGRGVHDGSLILFGGSGHDTLIGSDGADLIVGGGGADGLGGGAGADVFRYDAASDSTVATPDTVGDFQVGVDKFDLSRIDADSHQAGDQAFHWIGASAFSGAGAASAGELRVYADGAYQRVEGDTNGDGVADLYITIQIGTAPLTQGDFLL